MAISPRLATRTLLTTAASSPSARGLLWLRGLGRPPATPTIPVASLAFRRRDELASEVDASALDQLFGNDIPLDLVGPLPHDHQRGITEVAFGVVFR